MRAYVAAFSILRREKKEVVHRRVRLLTDIQKRQNRDFIFQKYDKILQIKTSGL